MSHYLETYSDVLQEQVTELAKFANNLDKVSKQLQEVCHMLNGRNKVVDNIQAVSYTHLTLPTSDLV